MVRCPNRPHHKLGHNRCQSRQRTHMQYGKGGNGEQMHRSTGFRGHSGLRARCLHVFQLQGVHVNAQVIFHAQTQRPNHLAFHRAHQKRLVRLVQAVRADGSVSMHNLHQGRRGIHKPGHQIRQPTALRTRRHRHKKKSQAKHGEEVALLLTSSGDDATACSNAGKMLRKLYKKLHRRVESAKRRWKQLQRTSRHGGDNAPAIRSTAHFVLPVGQ